MTKRILLILILFTIKVAVFAKPPSPKKHAVITGTWRVTSQSGFNTVAAIMFDSTYAVIGSYGDTYMKFSYEFISPNVLQLTDFNQHKYVITIRRLTGNKLVFDNLFNVDRKVILERMR